MSTETLMHRNQCPSCQSVVLAEDESKTVSLQDRHFECLDCGEYFHNGNPSENPVMVGILWLGKTKLEELTNLLNGEEVDDKTKDAETIWGEYIKLGDLDLSVEIKLVQAEPTPYLDVVLYQKGHEIDVCDPGLDSVTGNWMFSHTFEDHTIQCVLAVREKNRK